MDTSPNKGRIVKELEHEIRVALATGNCKGSRIIMELYLHTGSAIPAEELYNLENKQNVKNIADKVLNQDEDYIPIIDAYIVTSHPDSPIDLTDHKAIDEVKKELIRINYHLTTAMDNNDLGRVEDLKQQQEKYTGYLNECLTPTGRIRKTSDTGRKLAAALYRDVKYYLDKLALTKPDLSAYIFEHLKIGKMCMWSEEPVTRKNMKNTA